MKSKTFYLIKTNSGLIPADDDSREALKLVGFDDVILCSTSSIRNPKLHRKFMKMLRLGFDNQDEFNNFDKFRAFAMENAGHSFTAKDGRQIPYSVAFMAMDDVYFSEVYDDVHKFLCGWLQVEGEQLNELIDFI